MYLDLKSSKSATAKIPLMSNIMVMGILSEEATLLLSGTQLLKQENCSSISKFLFFKSRPHFEELSYPEKQTGIHKKNHIKVFWKRGRFFLLQQGHLPPLTWCMSVDRSKAIPFIMMKYDLIPIMRTIDCKSNEKHY